MARLWRHWVMCSLLRRDDRWLGIEGFEPPRIRHHGKRRAAFDRWRGGNGICAEWRLPEVVVVFRIVPALRTGAFGLAQGLHEQAHNSPGGRAGIR